MLVVMVALEVGANVDRLVERTGYNRDFIENISLRMRKAGLWLGEVVDDSRVVGPKFGASVGDL